MRRRRKKVKSNFIWEKKSPYLFGIVPFLVVVMTFMIRCTLQIISGPLYNLYQTGNRTELFSHWRSYLLWGASAVMLVLAAVALLLGNTEAVFVPNLSVPEPGWGLAAYGAFLLIPTAMHLFDALRWHIAMAAYIPGREKA